MTRIAQFIADRLIMKPTRHAVSAFGKKRSTIPYRRGEIEAWTQRVRTSDPDEVDIFVVKYPGTSGRAERASNHPMDCWSDLKAELWSINPPGYGGSSGKASVRTIAEVARVTFETVGEAANGRPIIVMGNSLGTLSALYLAANYPVDGLVLRNPPPLRQLIVGLHGWWNLWLGSMVIAQRVPRAVCTIRNARQSSCPAVFVSSQKDQIVPVAYQQRVIQNYGGPFRLLKLENANHASSLNFDEQQQYCELLKWLREKSLVQPATMQLAGV